MWKLKSLSKITPKLRTLPDGVISLSSNLTGKWLESKAISSDIHQLQFDKLHHLNKYMISSEIIKHVAF